MMERVLIDKPGINSADTGTQDLDPVATTGFGLLPQRRGGAEKGYLSAAKVEKMRKIKNNNYAFLCALRVFCGNRCC